MKEDVLPEGWEKTKLGKYLYLKNGYVFKKTDYVEKSKHSYPIIRISDINNFTATDKNAIHTNYIAKGFELEKNDLLIAMSGATTGKLGVYKGNVPAYQNQRVGNLKLIGKGDSQFRNYLMLSLQELIEKLAYGGAQPNISGKIIEDIDINLPPLPEQQYLSQKLTALLDEVAQTKQRLEAIPALLKQFRQSVLADAVSGRLTEEWRSKNIHSAEEEFISLEKNEQDYLDKKLKDNYTTIFKEKAKLRNQVNIFNKVNIPEGWVEKPFFELCLLNRGFDLPTSQRTKGKYPILSAGGIIDYHNEFKVRGECVTVGRSGSVGQVFYTPKDCWVLNTALYVKDFGISIPKFVYYKLQAMNLAQYSSSTAVPTLNRNEFMFVPVTIPPKEEQTQIVQKVETYFALADEIEAQVKAALENVNLLTQSILAKAFNGELSAAWRNSQVTETQGNV
jgi:type I restriction-modification system specificity subunit